MLATLRPGDAVDGVFACTRKERLLARSGSALPGGRAARPQRALPARVFRDADLHGGRFDRGELVRVSGRVVRFREQTQLELERIERAAGAELDPAAFLPVAYRDLDELDGFLEHLAREVAEPGYRRLLERAARRRCAARGVAPRAVHARRPPRLPRRTARAHGRRRRRSRRSWRSGIPRLNRDLLICAAIVHDIGKTREFTYGATIEHSEEGRLLGHVPIGLRDPARTRGGVLDERRLLALEHCVLCHHGPDAAPGGRFASVEALALYRLNTLDASVKGALEHGLPPRAGAARR